MKRLLLVVALLIAPALMAQGTDRAVLLAPNGTVYTVESKAGDTTGASASRYLALTIQNGANVIHTNVPASSKGGNNWQPELAYDAVSDTLLVFWLRSPNTILATNELLFCTFQNGKWNEATSVEDVPYHFRYNLRVGVTRTVQQTDESGNVRQVAGLTVHAAWWDESGASENARYAMLTVVNGVVTDTYVRDLIDFVSTADLRQFTIDDSAKDLLRHPVVFESPDHDTVDVVFGDLQMNVVHRLTLKPVLQTRVRIPIGIRDTTYPGPKHNMIGTTGVSAVSGSPESLAYYSVADGQVKYMMFDNGVWGDAKSIAITNELSAESAVAALKRMVRGD